MPVVQTPVRHMADNMGSGACRAEVSQALGGSERQGNPERAPPRPRGRAWRPGGAPGWASARQTGGVRSRPPGAKPKAAPGRGTARVGVPRGPPGARSRRRGARAVERRRGARVFLRRPDRRHSPRRAVQFVGIARLGRPERTAFARRTWPEPRSGALCHPGDVKREKIWDRIRKWR